MRIQHLSIEKANPKQNKNKYNNKKNSSYSHTKEKGDKILIVKGNNQNRLTIFLWRTYCQALEEDFQKVD
jgi:hypothetical protein